MMTTFELFEGLELLLKNLRRNYEKTTDRVGCLNILMNSLNEDISVHFARKTNERVRGNECGPS